MNDEDSWQGWKWLMAGRLTCKFQKHTLTGGFKYFSFSPLLGEDFQFDDHTFLSSFYFGQVGIEFNSAIGLYER